MGCRAGPGNCGYWCANGFSLPSEQKYLMPEAATGHAVGASAETGGAGACGAGEAPCDEPPTALR